VCNAPPAPGTVVTGGSGGGAAAAAVAVVAPPAPALGGRWACPRCTFANEPDGTGRAPTACGMCGAAAPGPAAVAAAGGLPPGAPGMVRHAVPGDGECMFTSIGWLMDHRMDRGPHYRSLVVDYIRRVYGAPDGGASVIDADGVYPAAALLRPAEEYAARLTRRDTWGSAVELVILASQLRVEIVAVEIATARPYTFGEGRGATRRLYLVFDGIHYDPLHWVRPDGAVVTQLRTGDDADVTSAAALASALAAAERLRAARAFTDLARFSLQCGECGEGLTGQAGAIEHAKNTGHRSFHEFRAPAGVAAGAAPGGGGGAGSVSARP
jgi:ubiquitin thioesterase OTU1